jgi:hypothetical protein
MCKRRVAEGETRCWQHASGLRWKIKSLARSHSVGFALAVLSIVLTVGFGLASLRPHQPILPSSNGSRPSPAPSTVTPPSKSPAGPPSKPTAPSEANGELHSRIRIVKMIPVDNPSMPYPGINILFDNAGPEPITGFTHSDVTDFTASEVPDNEVEKFQDELLQWTGWQQDISAKAHTELYTGDQPEFFTVPTGYDAREVNLFQSNWNYVESGHQTLYIIVTFWYLDRTMKSNVVGVTESCKWVSLGFVPHDCGRNRSFLRAGGERQRTSATERSFRK